MYKKLCMFGMCFLLLLCTGCSSSYERDTSKGNLKTIKLYEAILKIQEKETFVVLMSQSKCEYCIDLKKILPDYLKNHKVDIYEVVLDEEQATQSENLMIIESNIQNFSSTPSLFYFKEGKQVSDLQSSNKIIDEKVLDDWVQEHKIDEVHK